MYNAAGKKEKIEKVLVQYTDLVRKIAHQIKAKLPANVEIDDLIQAGMIGLLDAGSRFKDDQGAQFATYASQRIRGAIMDELRSSDWMPRSIRKKMREVENAMTFLEQRLGRTPQDSEVAARLNMTLSEYQSVLSDCGGHRLVYFEDFNRDEEGDHFLDLHIQDNTGDALKILMSSQFKANLLTAIENLPEREKILMSLYYEQDLNLKEIGAVMNVTESRVSQLHSQAIARLRGSLKEELWTGQA